MENIFFSLLLWYTVFPGKLKVSIHIHAMRIVSTLMCAIIMEMWRRAIWTQWYELLALWIKHTRNVKFMLNNIITLCWTLFSCSLGNPIPYVYYVCAVYDAFATHTCWIVHMKGMIMINIVPLGLNNIYIHS